MTDKLVDAISSKIIDSDNISFRLIRKIAAKNYNVWNELGRGRAILN